MDRNELKLKAKQINKESNPSVFTMGLIYFLVTGLLAILIAQLSSSSVSTDNLEQFMSNYNKYLDAGNVTAAYNYVTKYLPTARSSVLAGVLTILKSVVDAGFLIFIIKTVRMTGAEFLNILDGFTYFFKLLLMYILKTIFITLGYIFLIFPGVIVTYALRMSVYLLIDHPDWGVFKCLSESASMMRGHKWELFCLDLSFLGWYLLEALCSLVKIYAEPFTKTTYTLFYQQLAGILDYTQVET